MSTAAPAPLGPVAVMERIQTLRARFEAPPRPGASPASTAATGSFADALGQALGAGIGSSPTVAAGALAGADQVLAIAQEYLGVPYVYGATDPTVGLDCSSFVQLVFRRVGIELPRVTYDQVNAGTPVTRDQLAPGDLVFSVGDGGRTHGHVGIYAGGGQWIVAPRSGDVVSVQPLPSDITAMRRVLPPLGGRP